MQKNFKNLINYILNKQGDSMSKLKLGVLFGGMSSEHDVSITSGTSVIKNLNKDKYEIYPIYIDKTGKWYEYSKKINEIDILEVGEEVKELTPINNVFEYLQECDVVFPVLHGLYGEDGSIQGLLEILEKPYVGCKILSSSIGMDKVYAKLIFEKAGIEQAKYIYIKNQDDDYIYVDGNFNERKCSISELGTLVEKNLKYPVFVKPSNSGSSVGIRKAHDENELHEALDYAAKYDRKILIEEEIKGREVECAVIGNECVEATCIGEILPAEEFYTFDAKYKDADSKIVIPANIDTEISEKIKGNAIKAFKSIDGSGLSRVDFFIEQETNRVIINEINTMPGFTQISMYPKLWEEMGLTYPELLDKLIELAQKNNC